MPTPRVEIRRIRLDVFVTGSDAMRMENELVGREEQATVEALDALGTRRVVARGHEGATTTPSALMDHREGEIFGQPRRSVIAQKGLAEPLGFPSGDHATPSAADGHCPSSTQDLQLDRSTLDTSDSKGHTAIVYFIVAKLFQQRV